MIKAGFYQKHAAALYLVALMLVMFSVSTASAGAIRIMPLGDSITRGWYGSANHWGYRKPLYDGLTGGGYHFNFVGSCVDGSFPDPEHEGHDGWRADEILNGRPGEPGAGKLAVWLPAHNPDVVLLHIGTNDVSQGNQDANEVNEILNVIDDYEAANNKTVTVILALIVNRSDSNQLSQVTTAFNDDVNAMALNRIANGDDIIIVDMESELNYPADLADGVHPNDTGYTKMANVWKDGLEDYFDRFSFGISGRVIELDGQTPVEGVLIQADDNDINDVTEANGFYEIRVPYGWSGIVTPVKDGYVFEPNSFTFDDVNQDYSDMNSAAALRTFRICGFVLEQNSLTPISDVNVSAENGGGSWTSRYGGGSMLTDANGCYEVIVDYNWSGAVIPSKYMYVFDPNSRNYQDVNWDTPDQNYAGNELEFKITGWFKNECNMPIAGVFIDANNGAFAGLIDVNGFYEVWVDSGWTGVVMPMKQHFLFEPSFMSYVNVTANQADQNYAANSEYDLDCDGSIGWGDDAILTDNWLLPGPQGDFTGDDIINFLDFVEFAIVWEDR